MGCGVALLGNERFEPEHVVAYEEGYRGQPAEKLSVGVTVFFNDYHSLESAEHLPGVFVPNTLPPLLLLPVTLDNKLYGTTEGTEAAVNWKVSSRWTLSPGYSFLEMHLHTAVSYTHLTLPTILRV